MLPAAPREGGQKGLSDVQVFSMAEAMVAAAHPLLCWGGFNAKRRTRGGGREKGDREGR